MKATRDMIAHPGSVVVMPIQDDGKIVLIRQYRYAARQYLWELVAGRIDAGENPKQAAKRELIEETGLRAKKFRVFLEFWPSPGFLEEKMFVLLAEGITQGEAEPEEDEKIDAKAFTRAEIEEMLQNRRAARRQNNFQFALLSSIHGVALRSTRFVRLLYSLTVALGAFLLFLLEPLFAKMILPRFGGSAAVWSTCLVFFQSALLLGYYYADVLTRRLSATRQLSVQIALLLVSLALMPIAPHAILSSSSSYHPAFHILVLLTASIGLPFVLLSATSPLIQAWKSRTGAAAYHLFCDFKFRLVRRTAELSLLDRAASVLPSPGAAMVNAVLGVRSWSARWPHGCRAALNRVNRAQPPCHPPKSPPTRRQLSSPDRPVTRLASPNTQAH